MFCMKNRAHTIRVQEEVKDSSLWRARVARAAQDAMLAGGPREADRLWNTDRPVRVMVTFLFGRKVGIDGSVIPSHATELPTDIHIGDVDKLSRNVLDALVDAHVIRDDSQVAALACTKEWCGDGDEPGATITVATVMCANAFDRFVARLRLAFKRRDENGGDDDEQGC